MTGRQRAVDRLGNVSSMLLDRPVCQLLAVSRVFLPIDLLLLREHRYLILD